MPDSNTAVIPVWCTYGTYLHEMETSRFLYWAVTFPEVISIVVGSFNLWGEERRCIEGGDRRETKRSMFFFSPLYILMCRSAICRADTRELTFSATHDKGHDITSKYIWLVYFIILFCFVKVRLHRFILVGKG